jgi:DNA-binding transcriptional MerR regulator
MTAPADRRWTIGEVARASGLTVRTLYHYDEIGLVSAGERTPAGHRRYTPADLRRLYRVRALRRLGLSLEEIRTAIDQSSDDPAAIRALLTAQLSELDAHADRIADLRNRIRGLLNQLDSSGMPETDQFLAALERMITIESYLTEEQLDALASRRAELGEESVEALRQKWLMAARKLHRHVLDGTPVDDPRVRELADQWESVVAAMRTSVESIDTQVTAAVGRMWQDNGAAIGADLNEKIGWAGSGVGMAEVFEYLERIRGAR